MSGKETSHLALANRIRTIVSHTLYSKMRNEEFKRITITDVRMTADRKHCFLYYTVLGDGSQKRDISKNLKASHGFIKKELAKALPVRILPTIEFVSDELPEYAKSIEEKLNEARKRDEQTQTIRSEQNYNFEEIYDLGEPDEESL